MLGLAITLALVLALAAVASRRVRTRRLRALAATLPGATAATAIPVEGFDAIDAALRARRCLCGGFLSILGERSETAGDRVLRAVRAECGRCEQEQTVYFDPSALLH